MYFFKKIFMALLVFYSYSFSNNLTLKDLHDKTLFISHNSFEVLEFEKRIQTVKVSSKEMLEVTFHNNENRPLKAIKIFAKKMGTSNILITFSDTSSIHLYINVVENVKNIIALAQQISPEIIIEQTNNKVILKGNVQNQKSKDVIINLFKKANIELEDQLIDLTTVKNPDKMVRIKLYVVQIDNSKDLKINNDWSLLGFNDGTTSAEAIFESSTSISGGLTAIANRVGSKFNVGLTLQYLKTQEVAEILDETTLITLEDNESKFHSGGTINARVATGDTVQFTQIEYGLKMGINVQEIIDGKYVKLLVNTESSSIDEKVERVDNIPAIKNKTIKTNVVVGNLSTVVLGGLINIGNTQYEEKIPILGDIPILGRLFTSSQDSTDNKELVFFITPEIVDPKSNNQAALLEEQTRFREDIQNNTNNKESSNNTIFEKSSIPKSDSHLSEPEQRLNQFLGY